ANRPPVGIRGRIVTKGSIPIAGAQVVLQLGQGFRNGFGPGRGGRGGNQGQGQGRQQVNTPFVTGADGVFKVSGRGYENPLVTLVVAHNGHATTIFTKEFDKASADLDVGDVPMSVGGRIFGSITDVDGNAVPTTTATLRPAGGNRLNFLRGRGQG